MRSSQTPASPTIPAKAASGDGQLCVMPSMGRSAWDAVIATVLTPGDLVLVLGTGPMQTLWAGIATRAGLAVEHMAIPTEAGLARHLGKDRFGAIKALFIAPAADGPGLDPVAVRHALDGCFHDARLFVDASAAPGTDLSRCHADVTLADPETGLARLVSCRPLAAE